VTKADLQICVDSAS